MSILDKIKRGTADLPPRIVLSGPEGIGKSTFASKAPNPLFIAAEDGLTGLEHVQRITQKEFGNLSGFYAVLDNLIADPGGFKTVVIDTADWLERFVTEQICKRDGQDSIESYGYGKGYVVLENEMVSILSKLDALRARKLNIIILSHVSIRLFNDPRGTAYDRYEMKGHKKWTGLLREWPDFSGFAVFEVFKSKDKAGREKTIGGERIIHTTWSPGWDAKNRLNLPDTIPLDWDEFQKAMKENSSETLRASLKTLYSTAKIEAAEKPRWEKWMAALDSQSADKLKTVIEKLQQLQQTVTVTNRNQP